MALSDYEKQVLAQMEAQLKEADPSLASVMTSSLPEEAPRESSGQLSPRRVALGSIISVAGLAVILGGVSLGFGWAAVLLGVVGFVLMVAGVLLAVKTDAGAGSKGPVRKKRSAADFMERQRSRWDNTGRR